MMQVFDPFRSCLYCEAPVETFEPGPRGGSSQNMTCAGCGARYNLLMIARFVDADGTPKRGPLFLETLSPPNA